LFVLCECLLVSISSQALLLLLSERFGVLVQDACEVENDGLGKVLLRSVQEILLRPLELLHRSLLLNLQVQLKKLLLGCLEV